VSDNIQQADTKTTRERVLQAALKCFGHRDYDSVSTREIVELAGANISAISYHFGGKQGLYLATAEYLSDYIQGQINPLMEDINQRMERADQAECRHLIGQLIQGLVQNLLFGELSEDAAGLIFREQNHPTAAFDYMYDKFMLPMQDTYSRLIAKIMQSDPDSQEVKLLTHSLVGQIVIYRMGRETILRRLGKSSFSTHDVKQIAALITNISLKAIKK